MALNWDMFQALALKLAESEAREKVLCGLMDDLVSSAKQLTVARVNQGEERSEAVMASVQRYYDWVHQRSVGVDLEEDK